MSAKIINTIELSFIKGLGKVTIKKLFEKYSNVENIFNLSYGELSKSFGKKVADLVLNRKKDLFKKAVFEYERAKKLNVKIVTFDDQDYPENLKQIPDPPVYIYVKGKLPVPFSSVSIVGTRKVNSYGKLVTEKFSKELAKEGINIVSGLASGVDTIAHKTTLENEGFTTAVIGCGIDIIFPPENRNLFYQIQERGCIISEFTIGTKPSKYTFPQRNRLIAGISLATIITQAPIKSGALITASYSNEYGRVVFSVPANINNPDTAGNNYLLKEGAYPLTDIEDVFLNLPYLKKGGIKKINKETKELSDIENKILSLLSQPSHIDTIVEKTGLNITELSVLLFNMEIKGLIKGENGIYIRTV